MRHFWLLAYLLIFAFIGCKPIGYLSVRSINENEPLIADVRDYYIVKDDEPRVESLIPEYTVPVEFVYTYAGHGLPTATPYVARLTEYEIRYKDPKTGVIFGEVIKGGCNFEVPADVKGARTAKAEIKVAPAVWIIKYPQLKEGLPLDAYITFTGKDNLTKKDVSCGAILHVNFGDYYDDPTVPGG